MSTSHNTHGIVKPKLSARVRTRNGALLLEHDGAPLTLAVEGVPLASVDRVLRAMDGQRTLTELATLADLPEAAVALLVHSLDLAVAIDECAVVPARSGIDAMLEIEDLANDLLARSLYRNVFWRAVQTASADLPRNVIYGMCIENYHFLFRESYFDSPALCYQANTQVRLAMNAFYGEEYGHDEILLKSLNSLGITREDLAQTIPLPQTMALCNALAYWASYDQLFFFTTLGILEGREMRSDSYVSCCEKLGMDPAFVNPIRAHANLNIEGEHGSLTRAIFQHVNCVDEETVRRWRRQTHLFVEIYDAFYTAVWEHYAAAPTLLRRVDEI